jgi:hypothetical protein
VPASGSFLLSLHLQIASLVITFTAVLHLVIPNMIPGVLQLHTDFNNLELEI